MNFTPADLPLLTVFDAVMVERNVSRAGRRLGMSQPAVSNALNRLRALLEDQLFIRSAEGMRPTARAIALSAPIAQALRQISDAIRSEPFIPQTAQWTFNLALSDHTTVVLLPPLLKVLKRTAPKVRLNIHSKFNASVQDDLDKSVIDLAIGIIPPLQKRFSRATLFKDRYVCMMRKDHPLAGKQISAEAFNSAEHLVARPTLDAASLLDQRLKEVGGRRQTSLNVVQFLAVPRVILNSDFIVCVFESVSKQFDERAFYFSPLPFKVPHQDVAVVWNKAATTNDANAWIRRCLVQASKSVTN